jgi:hypothetical protein
VTEIAVAVTLVRVRREGGCVGFEWFLPKPDRLESSSRDDQEREAAASVPETSRRTPTRASGASRRRGLSVDGGLHTTSPCFGKKQELATLERGILVATEG